MLETGYLEGIENTHVVVVSDGEPIQVKQDNHSGVHFPKEALETLEKEGFQEALVAGGGQLNGSFTEQDLVNKSYLDIEPIALGKGIKLFNDKNFEVQLKLLETKKLSENEIQLHYRVV